MTVLSKQELIQEILGQASLCPHKLAGAFSGSFYLCGCETPKMPYRAQEIQGSSNACLHSLPKFEQLPHFEYKHRR